MFTAHCPTRRAAILLSALAPLLLPACAGRLVHEEGPVRFEPPPDSVERYELVEVALRLPAPPAGNPFTDAEITGELDPPGAPRLQVDGFCDAPDGSVFRLRFLPTRTGRHDYAVYFRWGELTLNYLGSFDVRPGRRKGLLRVDKEHPWHFLYEGTGEHFFWNSTTAYWLLGFQDEALIRESLDRLARLRVNRIRVALNGRTRDAMRWREPDIVPTDRFQFRLEPWPAARPLDIEDPGYDVTRFNVAHFQKCDRLLRHALDRDLIVSLIFHLDGRDKGVDPFGKEGMGGPDEQRYYRYVVARFAAFANVMWDVTNEWHLFRDELWVEKMGSMIKDRDPYDHLTSVHGRGDFPFRKSPWVDYVMFQSWDEHGSHAFLLKHRQEQAALGRPLPQVNEEYGYEDHYPYPWGEKRVWPARIAESRVRLAWEMAMAGAYQTTGERANVPGYGGWITGRGDDAMTMLHGYARLRAFFERLEHWKLEPRQDLVNEKTLCLAEPGRAYVVYLPDGGVAELKLEPGAYLVERHDPRTGASAPLPDASGEKWTSPRLPKNENWAFVLRRRD